MCIKRVGVGNSLICYLNAPRPTLGHYQGDNTNHCVIQCQPKGHKEPHNEVTPLSLAEHLVRFKSGIFQFYHVLTR